MKTSTLLPTLPRRRAHHPEVDSVLQPLLDRFVGRHPKADTTLIDPAADGSAVRVSFVAGGSDPYYRIKLAVPAGPANIWVGLAETTPATAVS